MTTNQASQQGFEEKQQDEMGTGGRERLMSIYSDEDVEMISEELLVPSDVSDADATASVLQVFQSVGETIFEKR